MTDAQMSVIVLVDRQRERGARCLRSLLDQAMIDRLEVVLIDMAPPGTAPLPGSDHPRVLVLRLDPTLSFGQLLSTAVLCTHAPIVASIEEHCVALPGWAEALVRAHRAPVAAVGGERHNPAPGEPLARFIHFLDDGPWAAPATAQATRILPEGNIAYKREVLLRHRERLHLLFQCEGLLTAELVAEGLEMRVEPAARYLHEYDASVVEASARWFWQGWVVGATRAELLGWTPAERRANIKYCLQRPLSTLRTLRAAPKDILHDNLRAALMYAVCPAVGEAAGTALQAFGVKDRLRANLINGRRGAHQGSRG
jgi:hypothetical protein